MKRRLLDLAVTAPSARETLPQPPPAGATENGLQAFGTLDAAGGQSVCFSRDGSRILTAGDTRATVL